MTNPRITTEPTDHEQDVIVAQLAGGLVAIILAITAIISSV